VRADTPLTGSNAYQVIVEDQAGSDGLGTFGAITGPDHPLGDSVDVLSTHGGIDAYSSYLTVRSYTTGTDYVQTSSAPASGNLVIPLEPYGSVFPVAGGYRAFYDVPASSTAGESLAIASDVTVTGDGLDSVIVLTATITNRNAFPAAIGVRYLLDVSQSGDDGPSVSVEGSTFSNESDIAPVASPVIVSPPTIGASFATPSGTAEPDAVVFAHWNRAFESAFDFTPDGSDVASAGGLNDSALLYYFGHTSVRALTLGSNESATFSVSIGQLPAENCSNGIDDDLDGLADAADSDCASPTPAPSTTNPSPSVPTPSPPGGATPSPTTGPASLPNAGGGLLGVPAAGFTAAVVAGIVLLAVSAATLRTTRRR
jgi:hypothetical protein